MPPLDPATAIHSMALIIQLAIAPIFLLVGVGSFLNVVTARLGRIVDRARVLELELETGASTPMSERYVMELRSLDRRMIWGNRAVLFCAVAALLICLVVTFIFIGEVVPALPTGRLVGGLFLAAVASLITGIVFFLREVSIATGVLRVRTELLARGS